MTPSRNTTMTRTMLRHPHCVLLVTLAIWLVAPAQAALPEAMLEGSLLGSATLEGGVELGVYGPRLASPDEPALLGVVLAGSEDVTISSGLVLLAAAREAVSFAQVPAPAGAYTPFGQWSPDFESETQQLLCLNADAQWALRIMAMAPLGFAGGPGEVLDAVVVNQLWAHPPPGPPFRASEESALIGVAFIADENVRRGADLPASQRGAHRVLLTIPLVFRDPTSPLSLWVAYSGQGRQVTHRLTVSLTPRESTDAPAPVAEEGPAVEAPLEGAEVTKTVLVSGKTQTPGNLIVAWLEPPRPETEGEPKEPHRVRYLSRRDGGFSFEVALPQDAAPGTELALHVRAEAPGYKSPETLRRVVVR